MSIQSEMKDFTDSIVNITINILLSKGAIFPENWTKKEKIIFVNDVIQYAEEAERYEDCAKLKEILVEVEQSA